MEVCDRVSRRPIEVIKGSLGHRGCKLREGKIARYPINSFGGRVNECDSNSRRRVGSRRGDREEELEVTVINLRRYREHIVKHEDSTCVLSLREVRATNRVAAREARQRRVSERRQRRHSVEEYMPLDVRVHRVYLRFRHHSDERWYNRTIKTHGGTYDGQGKGGAWKINE